MCTTNHAKQPVYTICNPLASNNCTLPSVNQSYLLPNPCEINPTQFSVFHLFLLHPFHYKSHDRRIEWREGNKISRKIQGEEQTTDKTTENTKIQPKIKSYLCHPSMEPSCPATSFWATCATHPWNQPVQPHLPEPSVPPIHDRKIHLHSTTKQRAPQPIFTLPKPKTPIDLTDELRHPNH